MKVDLLIIGSGIAAAQPAMPEPMMSRSTFM